MELLTRLREKLQAVEYRYVLDKKELGKVMIVVSATLLLFSAHTVLTLNDTLDEMQDLEKDYNRLSSILNSEAFNESFEAIVGIQSSSIGGEFRSALDAFRQTRQHAGSIDRVIDRLEQTRSQYQWLVLLGILGIVTGLTTLYI